MTLAVITSFFGITFGMVGVVFLFIEVDRNHSFSRFMPMVQVFRRFLEIERKKFADPMDYLRPEVRGESFKDDLSAKTMKAFRMKRSPPVYMKEEIMDFAFLLAGNPNDWEKAIEENEAFMAGLRITRNATLLRWGVGFLLFSGALQLLALWFSIQAAVV